MKINLDLDTADAFDLELMYRMFGVPTLQTEGEKQHVIAATSARELLETSAPELLPTAVELKNQEGDVIDGKTEVPTTKKKATKEKKTTKKKEPEPEIDVMPATAPANPATAVTVDAAPAALAGRSLTLKEVRDAFTKYVKDTSFVHASALLAKFEIKRVSDLDESKYVEFFEAIRGN